MEQLRKIHGDLQPAYKYRLWAEMIVYDLFHKLTHSKLVLLINVAK